MTQAINAKFSAGQTVVDRDGFKGRVVNITNHAGSVWYDVRFDGGVAVRYDSDLRAL